MWSRRYLRRSVVIALLLPVIVLVLFAIYQNRLAIFSDNSLHHHHHHHPHQANGEFHFHYQQHKQHHDNEAESPRKIINKNKIEDYFPLKRLTTGDNSLPKARPNADQKPFPMFQPPNVFNNPESYQIGNPVQPASSFKQISAGLQVIETKNLESFVHLDLKGAAPKVSYFEKLFPYLKELGANGLLIEYEDMFPFSKNLSIIRHDLAYSKDDIRKILKLAEDNHLRVMPLIQVYGHLEYVLKLKEFMHLREDKRYPQVITPCLEESYKLLFGKYL